MRVAVYTEYVYREVDRVVYAERAFALFLAALVPYFDRVSLIGRLAPDGDARYALAPEVELRALPYYQSLASPVAPMVALIRSLRALWRALDNVDVVWAMGPYPHAIALVLIAHARRRPVILGVRQDWPRYVRARRPASRWMHVAADLLEAAWRRLARRCAVVAVGPELSANYSHAPAVLDLTVSLVTAASVADTVPPRDYAGRLTAISVGRLEEEKNPLLMADVLACLQADGTPWHLRICGEGEMAPALSQRCARLGVEARAELSGYIPMGERLFDLYRSSHALLHVSWTEGFPQVLIEAFATGLPVVATAVGGVAAGVGDAALLIAPGDARAAATALARIGSDPGLRDRLARAGLQRAAELTMEAQSERLAGFLLAQALRPARAARAAL